MATGSDPEGAPFQTFRWNFGDGKVSTLPPTALFHTYTTPGTYVVTLTATTSDGHQASSFAGVIVTPPSQ
jgi:PKD repeat protein